MNVIQQSNGFSVRAYQGDAKTLLAFNLTKTKTKNLAGFTIAYSTDGTQPPFYVQNNLRFKDPTKHAQDASKSPNSSLNAPIHKFRWVQVPGSLNQGTKPFYGPYTYTVTPRYFDGTGSLLAIDPAKSLSVTLDVGPFSKGKGKAKIEVGNTRGFVQSQAFVHHFGPKAIIRPKGDDLLFDTSQVAGKNNAGKDYTFAEEYEWLGFTAEDKILAILNEVLSKKTLRLDMFAYDLNAPDILKILLELAKQGRIRLILDNADLHHKSDNSKPEDKFAELFKQKAKAPAEIMRGKFGRYAHHKVLIVSNKNGPVKVLTGSTNFSVTGLYVNSNHVLVFNEPKIADMYAQVFKDAWEGGVSAKKFRATAAAGQPFQFPSAAAPKIEINFSPHEEPYATKILNDMAGRITNEGTQKNGSVLFAVMGISGASGAVLPALQNVHSNEEIFSYGISDSPDGIFLYTPRKKTGVLVSGKPNKTKLPPPFDQVPQIGLGHQVHHKFVVCGFNGRKPVVYCGSSNLALGGEEENGDNLIAIYDGDIATVFAIEALALVDHFDFLDRSASEAGQPPTAVNSPSPQHLAAEAGWFLSTSDRWVTPYFDSNDLRCIDRELFA